MHRDPIDLGMVAEGRCRDLFSPRGQTAGLERIGAELELIPVDALTRRRCPIVGTDAGGAAPTLPVLRRVAGRAGWVERPSPYGAPVFVAPDGAVISYEPGGQIEYSAAPTTHVGTLVARLRAAVQLLESTAVDAGIELLTVGIDPSNAIEDVPLQLQGMRYTTMDGYLAAIGSAGRRMMRQTAACQVTLDVGDDPVARWQLLSGLAPYVTALFANSPRYAGSPTGVVSTRAETWRQLDPTRTGLPGATAADPAGAYEQFALHAPSMFHRRVDGTYPSFRDALASGEASAADWGVHLTTLFPEIRPRRIAAAATFEVRSADAMPVAACAALCVFLVGVTRDREARASAQRLLRSGGPGLLARAGEVGLQDPGIRRVATALYGLGLAGAARLGDAVVGGPELETAREFALRYVLAGRSPGDDDTVGSPTLADRSAPHSRDGRHVAAAR